MKLKISRIMGMLLVFTCVIAWRTEASDVVSIEEGLYFFNVESDNHFVMNVNGNYSDEGTNIDIAQNNNLDCQKFQVISLEDGFYRIVSLSNGLDLTIAGNSSEKEANVQLNKWAEGNNQKWRFLRAGEDRFFIESALGTYIDNYGGNLTDGNNVWMYEANGSATQMWMLTEAEPSENADAGNTSVEVIADSVESFSGEPGEAVIIEDGTYCINVEADNTYVLNVNGNYTDDGATIDIMPNVNADCQKFEIKRLEDGYYTITAQNSRKVLDVAGGSAEPETDLQQRTYDGSDGQKWEFLYVDENRIKIKSALGTYIDNYGGNVTDANNVWMYGESDSASQIWMLTKIVQSDDINTTPAEETVVSEYPESFSGEPGENVIVEDGIYCINVEADNTYVMNVNGNYTEDGATIDIMPNVNADCQKFEIKRQEDGYYTITAQNSEKVLSVADDNAKAETDLQQWTDEGSDGQKWEFIYVDENRIKIRSALGTYIDNYGGNVEDANNVWMYGESDSASQLWMLTKVTSANVQNSNMNDDSKSGGQYISLDEYDIVPDGTYSFLIKDDENSCLAVSESSDDNGMEITIVPYDENPYQLFNVKNLGDNTYSILCSGSGKSMDVDGGSMSDGAKVQQWEYDGTSGQIWTFEAGQESGVYILSKLGTYISRNGSELAMYSDKPLEVKIFSPDDAD